MAAPGSQRCRISTLWLGLHLTVLNGCLAHRVEQTNTHTHTKLGLDAVKTTEPLFFLAFFVYMFAKPLKICQINNSNKLLFFKKCTYKQLSLDSFDTDDSQARSGVRRGRLFLQYPTPTQART